MGKQLLQRTSRKLAGIPVSALWLLPLLALLVWTYYPALQAGYIWDDDDYVTENPLLTDASGLGKIWTDPAAAPYQYYPLTITTLWVQYQIHGLAPFGYHLVNLLLHFTNAVLLWIILRRLAVPGALLAAAVFALHPVHVESVAWITERKNVLSAFFYLTSLLLYLRFDELTDSPDTPRRRLLFCYVPSLLLFICALLSKSVTATLPAVLALLLWWKQPQRRLRSYLPLVPFFFVGLTMAVVTIWVERFIVGAQDVHWGLSPIDRILIAGRALFFYASKILWPSNLAFIYKRWNIDSGALWQYLYPLAAVAVLLGLWLARKRIGRGAFVAVAFFAGTLFPALGFVDVYPMRFSFVADHFQYLASVGIIVLVCATATQLFTRLLSSHPGAVKASALALSVIFLGSLSFVARQQTYQYEDEETLWRETVKRNPSAWMGQFNLGLIEQQRGNVNNAVQYYKAALSHNPSDSKANTNIGIILAQRGQFQEAKEHFERAASSDPLNAETAFNLGVAEMSLGQDEEAIKQFQKAVEVDPDYAQAQSNLGILLLKRGDIEKASPPLLKAAALLPNDPAAQVNAGHLYLRAGSPGKAIPFLERALELNPAFAPALDALQTARNAMAQSDTERK